ncbi:hypothetical protein BMT55_01955 [Listeria newyorkensis]|uniref:Uncharacterized protein n=1 Tax=Listeria newyorkensis TaxID=1497681 RepID=A0ABX4XQF3_9LIST|nr:MULTISPECIES: hypothetical protein [Listeria]KGL46384.1 hypothetical protein EP56_01985 [Listeriaceae bacterium FSL A5-0209]KGL41816.1 hypothetical protein EP58_09725 [Listeria newyorkensis]KMT58298.1 hypothetical protein X559_3055 [Listeria newyorkensis]PNP94275.1 hypothetical protein BMT55_01955 [Listeria newyorkensis]RQW67767.1 hypothetical protein DUK53_05475 [Listeria sp. SHR_NRA_18]
MKKDGMKIEIIQDESGLAVPRQYIVVVDHQIFMEWLDYPNKPIFLIPAHVPNVRIDLAYIFFFKEMADKAAIKLGGKVVEIKEECYCLPQREKTQ